MNTTPSRWTSLTRLALTGVCVALAACSGPSRPKPTEIPGVPVLQDVRTSWTANVGKVDFPLVVSAREERIALANSQGVVAVLDATTGQNGLAQAKAFAEVAKVSGVVLTKLDGTAKGGIVYSIQRELEIPVKLVGVGEGIEDFAFFDAKEFANGLVS